MSNAICTSDGCVELVDCRGLCGRHYAQLLRKTTNRKRLRPHVRLLRAIEAAQGPDDCWRWDGPIDAWGYARVRNTMAHRWVYQILVGDIPPGMQLDHTCHDPVTCDGRNGCMHRRCVNPFHLAVVEPRTNALRSTAPTAVNAAKTTCIAGHLLSGRNLYVQKSTGKRYCRACQKRRQQEFLERRRAS